MPDPLYFEKIGNQFDEFMSDYDVSRRIELIFKHLFPCDQRRFERVLEVGCGTGRISEFLVDYTPDLTVSDISERLCQTVAERFRCSFRVTNACALAFESSQFDLVVSSECIEHTADPLKAIDEMCRVVRPGGYLILTTPNPVWYPVLWLSEMLKIRRFEGSEWWVWPREARRHLVGNGFIDIFFGGCHMAPWQVPGSKKVLPWFDQFGERLYPLMINYGFRARKVEGSPLQKAHEQVL